MSLSDWDVGKSMPRREQDDHSVQAHRPKKAVGSHDAVLHSLIALPQPAIGGTPSAGTGAPTRRLYSATQLQLLIARIWPEIASCSRLWRTTSTATPEPPLGSWSWRHVADFLGTLPAETMVTRGG